MTDAHASPDSPAASSPVTDPPGSEPVQSPERRGGLLPVVVAVSFLVLAVAIYYVWENPQDAGDAQELRALSGRIAALEQRPPPDLDGLASRVAALEHRPAGDPAAKAEQAQLATRMDALEKRPASTGGEDGAAKAEATQLAARVDALDKRAASVAETASKTDITQLASRLDAISQRTDQLAARVQSGEEGDAGKLGALDGKLAALAAAQAGDAALPDKIAALDQRIAALEKSAGNLPALADRQAHLARLQAATAALEAGQPVGQVPGAPPALARYATEKPPTLADLKLAFPAAMRRAEEASIPSPAKADLLERMWDRVQGLVVVRQGDSVVVGNPAAGVLAHAGQMLDAGDLAGAVQVVGTLTGPAAAAMADWLQSANNLLAARQAMAALAAHA